MAPERSRIRRVRPVAVHRAARSFGLARHVEVLAHVVEDAGGEREGVPERRYAEHRGKIGVPAEPKSDDPRSVLSIFSD